MKEKVKLAIKSSAMSLHLNMKNGRLGKQEKFNYHNLVQSILASNNASVQKSIDEELTCK